MRAIPAIQRKLRHARQTFQLLQASAHAIPLDHEVCERQVSDFLSAAYSVEDIIRNRPGKRPWVDRWWSKRHPEDQALHSFMRKQRKAELHYLGAAVRTMPQEISYQDYLRRAPAMQSGRHGGYHYGPQWSGPVGMEIPNIPVEIDTLLLGDEAVAERCGRYLTLLEQMVEAFQAAYPTS